MLSVRHMNTILSESSDNFYFHNVSFGYNKNEDCDELNIFLVEGEYADHDTAKRLAKITFLAPIMWQQMEESHSSFDEYEIRDDGGLIQIIERSRYFDFVNTTYPWYKDIRGKAQHIRVWSQNIVSEVIAKDIPAVVWQYA
ncbi:hypothetical protein GPSY_4924 [Paraglaciecola psychrophila 170]|nr:hypothetical protein GPSY_4924 [Paraglaciecola psychrophila 170]